VQETLEENRTNVWVLLMFIVAKARCRHRRRQQRFTGADAAMQETWHSACDQSFDA